MPEARKKRLTKTQSRVRAVKALQFKMAGYTYQAIAEQLGYSNRSAARKAVNRILDGYEKEVAEKYRAMENTRLEELQAVWWTKALYPGKNYDAHKEQLDATRAVLAIMKQRAALLGLEVDQRIKAQQEEEDRIQVNWDIPETIDEKWIAKQEKIMRKSMPQITSTSSPNNGEPQTQ